MPTASEPYASHEILLRHPFRISSPADYSFIKSVSLVILLHGSSGNPVNIPVPDIDEVHTLHCRRRRVSKIPIALDLVDL